MLHPALHLLATRPHWLAEHGEAYAQLAAAELGQAAAAWRRSAVLAAASLLAASVGLGLAGVALMLWAVMPAVPAQTAWLLWATPAVPLALAVIGALALRSPSGTPAFACLREQLQADADLLRTAGAPA